MTRGFPREALHLWVLFLLAVAQPLLDLLSRNTEFLIIHRFRPPDLIVLVLLLCFLMPAMLVLLEFISLKLRKAVHAVLLTLLIALLPLQFSSQVELPGSFLILGLLVLSAGVTLGYYRTKAVPLFFTYLWPAILIVPGFFFTNPQIHSILAAGDSLVSLPKVKTRTPVVMVILDEISLTALMDQERKIDRLRYPSFARLANESYWFRNSTTVSEETFYAVPAILTGNYPRPGKLPLIEDHPQNLYTLLGGSYEMNIFDSITRFWPKTLNSKEESPANRWKVLIPDLAAAYLQVIVPSDLAAHVPRTDQAWGDFWELRTRQGPDVFEAFLQSIGKKREGILHFMYCPLPHPPWKFLPSGKRYHYGGFSEAPDKWASAVMFQRYLLQLGLADTLLGRLMDKLKETGLYDEALIVVTSDHGVCFRPNELRFIITPSNYPDIMPVPLFIKAPHQKEGAIVDKNVETIDILPTIADMLGIPIPAPVNGRSVWDTSLPERQYKTMMRRRGHLPMRVDSDISGKWETLERKLALFGRGEFPDPSYSLGAVAGIIGQPVDLPAVVDREEVKFRLKNPEWFDQVDLKSDFVPAGIAGQVLSTSNSQQPLILGIAINGTFRAVTKTFSSPAIAYHFAAMVPESSFRSGKNKVQVFVLSGQASLRAQESFK